VSSNTPNQPGDGFDRENAPSPDRNDPLASNPYSNQYQQSAAPDLDANAPTLRSSDLRRMNRRALFYLVAIVVLLLAVAFWLIKGPSSKAPAPKQAETITVPVAPIAPPPLPTTPLVQAIPLNTAPTPPLPMLTKTAQPQPTKQQGPSLLERRLAEEQSNTASEAPAAPAASPTKGPGDELGEMEDTKTSARAAEQSRHHHGSRHLHPLRAANPDHQRLSRLCFLRSYRACLFVHRKALAFTQRIKGIG
jgi:type IV secretion system protein VirB10